MHRCKQCVISHNPWPETCPFGFTPHTNKKMKSWKIKKMAKDKPPPIMSYLVPLERNLRHLDSSFNYIFFTQCVENNVVWSRLVKCCIQVPLFRELVRKLCVCLLCAHDSECALGTHTFSFRNLLAVTQFFALCSEVFWRKKTGKWKKKVKICATA